MATGQTTRIRPAIPPLFYAKAFYFWYYGAVGGYLFFLSLYYRQIGLDDRQIGLLTGLPPLMTMISAPLWGLLSDRLGRGRRLLTAACLATLPIVGLISVSRDFTLIVPLTLLHAFFVAPIVPLGDHTTLMLLGEQRQRYGEQRIWGAVGFGLAAWGAGMLTERFGLHWIFMIYIGVMLLCTLVTLNLSVPAEALRAGAAAGSRLGALLRRRTWQFFLLSMLLAGASIQAVNSFYPLYFQSLGGREGLYGFAIGLSCLSELPIFFFSARLLRRWGAGGMLILALAIYVLRWLFYSLAGSPELLVAGQAVHGLTFSALWVAGVSYAEQQAPPGMGATAQGLFSSAVFGLAAIGSIIGGLIYAAAGPVALFRTAALVVVLALLAFLGARASERRARREV